LPRYSSELDNRSFVPGRLFPPKGFDDDLGDDNLIETFICRSTTNWANPRGKWLTISLWSIIGIFILLSIAVCLSRSE
jgi:hypothetical protein